MTAKKTTRRTDKSRLDKIQSRARERGCGWMLDNGSPVLKHFSQEPPYEDIRQAIDAMLDPTGEE